MGKSLSYKYSCISNLCSTIVEIFAKNEKCCKSRKKYPEKNQTCDKGAFSEPFSVRNSLIAGWSTITRIEHVLSRYDSKPRLLESN